MASNEEDILKIFNNKKQQNQICDDIARFLLKKYENRLSVEDAFEIATKLYKQESLNIEKIQSGNYDSIIDKNVRPYIIRKTSVYQEGEVKNDKPLESKKKETRLGFFQVSILAISTVAIVLTFQNAIKDKREEAEIRSNLGKLATTYGSSEYENGISIVSQNTYQLNSQNSAGPMVAYHNDKIALDIISVCTKDPQLFSVCMNNVYNDMKYNRLENMDAVLNNLKIFMASDEALEPIYRTIANESVFLDYVTDQGFADPNSKDYFELMNAITHYKELKSKSSEMGQAFNGLSSSEQELIKKLMKNYSNNKDQLYDEFIDDLEQAINKLDDEFNSSRTVR